VSTRQLTQVSIEMEFGQNPKVCGPDHGPDELGHTWGSGEC
jgi:hypothetical protein